MKPCYFHWVAALLVALVASAACAAATTQPTTQRTAVPDEAAQKKARDVVAEAYRAQLAAAKTESAKGALARKMLQSAIDTSDDPIGRFVLLQRARELASDAGDVDTALAAIAESQRDYDLDGIALKIKFLNEAARKARLAADLVPLLAHVNETLDDCVSDDRFADAKALARLGVAMAGRMANARVAKEARQRSDELGTIENAFVAIQRAAAQQPTTKPAATQLTATEPATTESSSTQPSPVDVAVAKYVCFIKGDWDAGLQMLARVSDENLQKVSKAEQEDPQSPTAQLALADLWWDLSMQEQGLARNRLQAHAAAWYSKALSKLTGLARAKAEGRIKAAQSNKPLLGESVAGAAKSRAAGYKFAAIPSNDQWTKVNLTVSEGSYYEVSARGSWTDGIGKSYGPIGAGALHYTNALGPAADMTADAKENVYYMQHPRGSLIARINDESWSFFCGDHAIFYAPQSGEISFRINDAEVASDKRSGNMHVLIRQVPPPMLQQPDGTTTLYAVVDVRDELHLTPDGLY